MTKTKSTKRALLMSGLALLMCVSMLIGSTFAWFTDSVTSAGNTIQSGTLNVDLVDAAGNSLEGKVIKFVDQDENSLWEPGCTYKLEEVFVKNKGTLALKYEIAINGITGDAKLLEAIEWTVTVDGVETALSDLKGYLLAGETSKAIVLSGHMKEEAGNEYQGLTVSGISISVLATQLASEFDSFNNQYDNIAFVSNADALKAAIAEGKNVMLTADVVVDDDKTITIPAGAEIFMDLNGNTLSGKSTKSGNAEMFLVKGELSVFNGTVEMSTTNNQGWNAMTAIFDVTAGGVLNINDATINNLGGTDMAFCVHMNNWGEVTLNVDNSTLSSNYCAVRVFNSGNDMNNVTITNSNLIANRALWVHNYTAADFGGDANKATAAAARLNMNVLIENPVTGLAADDTSNLNAAAKNTLVGSVSYGFTNREIYYSTSNAVVAASNANLDSAIKNGAETIYLSSGNYIIPDSAQGKTLKIVGNGDTVIATQDDGSYEGCDYSLDGAKVTFENVAINTDSGTYTGYARCSATYNNCTINGAYTLYGESVFNNCTFNVTGDVYNIWTWGAKNVKFTGCTFNTSGKSILVYNQSCDVYVNDCTFNDSTNGTGYTKSALETGVDGTGPKYNIYINNTTVNGFAENDKCVGYKNIVGNKNFLTNEYLNIVVDGVDVY